MKEIFQNIKLNEQIKNVRMDVGTSVCAPNSALWLSKYKNLAVFSFEPNPYNAKCVREGTDEYPHEYKIIETLGTITYGSNDNIIANIAESNNYFKSYEVAVDDVSNYSTANFYCTSEINTGCSSLHKPIESQLGIPIKEEVIVDVAPLYKFFEKFDWQQIPYIDFLKTDTQSNDLKVVKSCREYIKNVCFVQSEYYAHSAYEGELSESECFSQFNSYMISNGFRLYHKSGTDVSYVNENLISYIIQNNITNDCLDFPNGYNFLF
jgi:hypothetical protein